LVASGLGFSVAYFFDPDHGSARRKQAVELANHVRRATTNLKNRRVHKGPSAPTGTTAPEGAPFLRGLTNGRRANERS
jgi:hypothetical protein